MSFIYYFNTNSEGFWGFGEWEAGAAHQVSDQAAGAMLSAAG